MWLSLLSEDMKDVCVPANWSHCWKKSAIEVEEREAFNKNMLGIWKDKGGDYAGLQLRVGEADDMRKIKAEILSQSRNLGSETDPLAETSHETVITRRLIDKSKTSQEP